MRSVIYGTLEHRLSSHDLILVCGTFFAGVLEAGDAIPRNTNQALEKLNTGQSLGRDPSIAPGLLGIHVRPGRHHQRGVQFERSVGGHIRLGTGKLLRRKRTEGASKNDGHTIDRGEFTGHRRHHHDLVRASSGGRLDFACQER